MRYRVVTRLGSTLHTSPWRWLATASVWLFEFANPGSWAMVVDCKGSSDE